MEKIYTQEQGQKGRKKNTVNFSVILSFTVAIFALFSVAMFGVFSNQKSNVSYAAPVPDSFKLIIPDVEGDTLAGITSYTADGTKGMNVPMYYANEVGDDNHVFCVELNQDWENGTQYTKTDLQNDAGLMYIMNNSYANGVSIVGGSKELEIWATQSAIWLYLAEQYKDEAKYKFGDGTNKEDNVSMKMKEAITNAASFRLRGGPNSGDEITATNQSQKVIDLVNKAKAAEALSLTVSAANDTMSKTSDGKFYQTALITVTGRPANSLQSYEITSITGIDGVKVVDENGAEMALKNIAPGKKFYLRIPTNKVNDQTKTLRVSVSGNFKSYVYYTAAGKQTVVGPGNVTGLGGIDFEIAGSPDTGMNAAQTIYFIGLIVLLCGVGIVYANAKPVESKQ